MSNKRKSGKTKPAAGTTRFNFKIIAAALLAAAAVAAFYMTSRAPAEIVPGDGILSTPISSHDFGNVSLAKGAVSTELPLVNSGDEDLVISFLDSSCGCTSARIINDGEAGPLFGMSSHGNSPRDWRTTIAPGGQATLRIYYDPLVHRNFRGAATRVITITSNARTTPEVQVRITVNQTD